MSVNTPIDNFQFKNVQIFKDKPLGNGAYGTVYKAKCDQLPCAAKILHQSIIDVSDPGAGKITERFEQECRILRTTRHPCIVQYLQEAEDPQTNRLVLFMELIDENLTHMLERFILKPLPDCTQIDLIYDIALAVAYLHTRQIIHRDLSSNNILVVAGKKAKVGDFGMAKFFQANKSMPEMRITRIPGTLVYMPPEAIADDEQQNPYTEKLDCFSVGVLMVQIYTRLYPKPDPATRRVEDPQNTGRKLCEIVPEIERRKKHIDLIDQDHPLLGIAKMCLYDEAQDRPSADEICKTLETLKEDPTTYGAQSVEENTCSANANCVSKEHAPDIEVKTCEETTDSAVKTIVEIMDCTETGFVLISNISTKPLLGKRETIQAQVHVDRHSQSLPQPNSQDQIIPQAFSTSDLHMTCTVKHVGDDCIEQKVFQLQWKEATKSKRMMMRGTAVTDGEEAYFLYGKTVCSYHIEKQKWTTIDTNAIQCSSLAIIRGLLTTIGGKLSSNRESTNELRTLIAGENTWNVHFPPMATKRCDVITVQTEHKVIVAGGMIIGASKDDTNVVEVLDTDYLMWCQAASLPQPMSTSSATLCSRSETIYILGNRCSMKCLLSDLLDSCPPVGIAMKLKKHISSLLSKPQNVWQEISSPHCYKCTCAYFDGQVLAIGGLSNKNRVISSVQRYNTKENSWDVIGHMTIPRYNSLVCVLDKQLLVVGGCTTNHQLTKSAEFAFTL